MTRKHSKKKRKRAKKGKPHWRGKDFKRTVGLNRTTTVEEWTNEWNQHPNGESQPADLTYLTHPYRTPAQFSLSLFTPLSYTSLSCNMDVLYWNKNVLDLWPQCNGSSVKIWINAAGLDCRLLNRDTTQLPAEKRKGTQKHDYTPALTRPCVFPFHSFSVQRCRLVHAFGL